MKKLLLAALIATVTCAGTVTVAADEMNIEVCSQENDIEINDGISDVETNLVETENDIIISDELFEDSNETETVFVEDFSDFIDDNADETDVDYVLDEEAVEDGSDRGLPWRISPSVSPERILLQSYPQTVTVKVNIGNVPFAKVRGQFRIKNKLLEYRWFSLDFNRINTGEYAVVLPLSTKNATESIITFMSMDVVTGTGEARHYSIDGTLDKKNIYLYGGDLIDPTVSSLTLSKEKVTITDKAKSFNILVSAKDNASGIGKIEVELASGSNVIRVTNFKKDETNKYLAKVKLPINQKSGTYKVKSIYVEDGVGNYVKYSGKNVPSKMARKIAVVRNNTLYNISFVKNGGKGSMPKLENVLVGQRVELPANLFTRDGYKFKGWNTKADGSGKNYKNKAQVIDLKKKDGSTIKLYAQWTKVK